MAMLFARGQLSWPRVCRGVSGLPEEEDHGGLFGLTSPEEAPRRPGLLLEAEVHEVVPVLLHADRDSLNDDFQELGVVQGVHSMLDELLADVAERAGAHSDGAPDVESQPRYEPVTIKVGPDLDVVGHGDLALFLPRGSLDEFRQGASTGLD